MLAFYSMCRHVCQITSVVSNFTTLWTVTHQAPLSMGFSRQEYWSGLSCPPPGDLPSAAIKATSSASFALEEDSLLLSHWGSPYPHNNPVLLIIHILLVKKQGLEGLNDMSKIIQLGKGRRLSSKTCLLTRDNTYS